MDLPSFHLVSAGVILAVMLALWAVSLVRGDSSIVDIAWGPTFVAIALIGLLFGAGWEGRRVLVAAMVGLWGLRLGLHIFHRNRGKGEDPRYARWRERYGPRWGRVSLYRVFLLQGAVLWLVSLPIQMAMTVPGAHRFTVWDALGELVWAIGFLYEAIADGQLRAFREDPAKGGVLDTGLWRTSRHPNYFGEAVLWWGIWAPALSAPLGWATAVSPLLMTLLLRYVSGVPLTERMMEGRAGWSEYVRQTPVFVPGPRRDD